MQDTFFTYKTTLNFNGNLEDINEPKILGILNCTPDSFYESSRFSQLDQVLNQAEKLITEGAYILDIGGYSSRPGANHISTQEEIDRVIPAIEAIIQKFPTQKISIDTFRSEVARVAVEAGACMINDISGGALDPNMYSTVAHLKTPYIAMHMPGTPQNMQTKTTYKHLMNEVIFQLAERVKSMITCGIKDIIIDPGFGFGKTTEQNYQMMNHLEEFHQIGHPVLVGISRKSMIYKPLGITASDALNGTTALHVMALQNGANFLRVHDVKEAKEAITLFNLVKNAGNNSK